MNKLPTKLSKEPLVDVVFELRFKSLVPASNVLPGVLFGMLNAGEIQRLPAADLPSQIRDVEPTLKYAPLVQIKWERFLILVGDKSIAVSCQMPYVGWAAYKEAILKVLGTLTTLSFIEGVERYSMKYVDLLPYEDLAGQVAALDIDLRFGAHKLTKELFQARIEIPEDGFIKIIQVAAGATVMSADGSAQNGAVVDVDIARPMQGESLAKFMESGPESLDEIHHLNKATFFGCLKAETIDSLGATYE